jgi:hypothetical protein
VSVRYDDDAGVSRVESDSGPATPPSLGSLFDVQAGAAD